MLKEDGRATNRTLAVAARVSEQTVASRLRRLEEGNLLRVVAVVGRSLHGYNTRLHFGLQTSGRSPRQVGNQLAKIPSVISVFICFGRHELVGVLLARTDREALDTLTKQFGSIKGIQDFEVLVDVEHIHYSLDYSRLSGASSRIPTLPLDIGLSHPDLDASDISIAREIMVDARLSFREISRRLKVSESFVRSRVHNMLDRRIMRFQAITDDSANPNRYAAYVAMQVDLGAIHRTGQALARLPACTSVTLTLGGFNLICTIQSPTHEGLADAIFENVGRLEGVRNLEIWEVVEVLKSDSTLLATDI
jgi:Lrp/AsnC family transcriptional regulator for asnA, asnC and gidA